MKTYTAVEHKYVKEKSLERDISGKNEDTSIVYSFSSTTANKKYWIAKPFGDEFDLSNGSLKNVLNYLSTLPFTENYRIYAAALDVYFGHLSAEIFGKEHSPKTKFNLQQKGIVSRIVGDEFAKCINFRTMLKKSRTKKFTLAEQISFLDAILYGIIIGDRDINPGNLVAQLMDDDINSELVNIYAIDHEFALNEFAPDKNCSLIELLKRLHKKPKDVVKFICDQSLEWNNTKKAYVKEQDDAVYSSIEEVLADSLNSALFIESLRKIIMAISDDDYKICYVVQEKIQSKISSSDSVYTAFEISIVKKIIHESIEKLKSNVKAVEQFLTEANESKPSISLMI